MATFKEDTEVIGIWFCGHLEADWLANIWVEGGKIRLEYRHWYAKDDSKHWYEYERDDSPEARIQARKTFDMLAQQMAPLHGLPFKGSFPGGTGKEAMEWMSKQSWVKMRNATPDEIASMGLQDKES